MYHGVLRFSNRTFLVRPFLVWTFLVPPSRSPPTFTHLQGDIFQQRVLQHSLKLLVDLQRQVQGHPGVGGFRGVEGGHDAAVGRGSSLEPKKIISGEENRLVNDLKQVYVFKNKAII